MVMSIHPNQDQGFIVLGAAQTHAGIVPAPKKLFCGTDPSSGEWGLEYHQPGTVIS